MKLLLLLLFVLVVATATDCEPRVAPGGRCSLNGTQDWSHLDALLARNQQWLKPRRIWDDTRQEKLDSGFNATVLLSNYMERYRAWLKQIEERLADLKAIERLEARYGVLYHVDHKSGTVQRVRRS